MALVARTLLGMMTFWLSYLRNMVVNMFISSTTIWNWLANGVEGELGHVYMKTESVKTRGWIDEHYLNPINFTSISHIKWVHDKQENNCFKYGLAGVSKYKCNHDNLWAHKEKKFGGGKFQYQEPNNQYNNSNYKIEHSMKFVHCRFGIIQCQSKCSPFPEGIDLGS